MKLKTVVAAALLGLTAASCSSGGKKAPVVSTSTTHRMTYEECQASATYPGGRYAVEYDNGVCKIQKP